MEKLPEMMGNVQLLKEVLEAINPAEEDPRQNELVTELFGNAIEYQKQIHEAIQRVAQEDALVQMLHYNDQLEDIQQLKNQLIEQHENKESLPPQPTGPSSFRGIDSPIRLDLHLGSGPSYAAPHQSPFLPEPAPSPAAAPSTEKVEDFDDFFDSLAQRHQDAPQSPPQAVSPPPSSGVVDLLGLDNAESFAPTQNVQPVDLFAPSSPPSQQSPPNPSYDGKYHDSIIYFFSSLELMNWTLSSIQRSSRINYK